MKEKTINLQELWMTKKLGDLCDIARGGSPRPIQQYLTNSPDGINWIKISDASASSKYIYETKEKIKPEGVTKSRLVQKDDFLLSNSMSFGRPYIMKTSGCIHDGWLVLKDKSGLFDQDYLYYFLNSQAAYKQFDNLAAGSTVRNLNTQLVKNVIIPIPPIEEQKRIVEILDKAFEGIAQAEANTRRNLANTRQFLANVRNNILNKNSNNWHPTTLKKEINLLSGFAFKSQFYTQSEDDISLLRGDNIMQGYLRWDNTQKWKKSEFDTFSKFKLKENDLVLAMDRPWVSAGLKYAEITSNDLPCLLVQRVARLRCCENLNNRFLFHLIGDRKFIKHILGKQTGIGVPHISGKQIESFEFLKPPLEKQKNIASLLDRIYSKTQKLETIYQSKLEAIAELKQSILEKAFTGQLSQ